MIKIKNKQSNTAVNLILLGLVFHSQVSSAGHCSVHPATSSCILSHPSRLWPGSISHPQLIWHYSNYSQRDHLHLFIYQSHLVISANAMGPPIPPIPPKMYVANVCLFFLCLIFLCILQSKLYSTWFTYYMNKGIKLNK